MSVHKRGNLRRRIRRKLRFVATLITAKETGRALSALEELDSLLRGGQEPAQLAKSGSGSPLHKNDTPPAPADDDTDTNVTVYMSPRSSFLMAGG